MALEDAYILFHLLGLCTGVSGLKYAFRAYNKVRLPRTHGVIKASREQGRILDLEGEGVGVGNDLDVLKLDARVRWI